MQQKNFAYDDISKYSQFQGFYASHGDFIWLESLDDVVINTLTDKKNPQSMKFILTLTHELNHSFIIRGTTTGLLLSRLDDLQVYAMELTTGIIATSKNRGNILNPFLEQIKKQVFPEEAFDSIGIWLAAEKLRIALDDNYNHLSENPPITQAIACLVFGDPSRTRGFDMQNMPSPLLNKKQYNKLVEALEIMHNRLSKENFICNPETKYGILRTIDIIEGIARASEYLTCLCGTPSEHFMQHLNSICYSKPINMYNKAFIVFLDKLCSIGFDEFEQLTSQIKTDLLMLYLQLCEFSLNGPWPICGQEIYFIDSFFEWKDLHPGWRFLRSLDVIGQSKWNYLDNKLPNDKLWFLLCQLICIEYNWPDQFQIQSVIANRLNEYHRLINFGSNNSPTFDVKGMHFVRFFLLRPSIGLAYLIPSICLVKKNAFELLEILPRLLVGGTPADFEKILFMFFDTNIEESFKLKQQRKAIMTCEELRMVEISACRELVLKRGPLTISPPWKYERIQFAKKMGNIDLIKSYINSWRGHSKSMQSYIQERFQLLDDFFE